MINEESVPVKETASGKEDTSPVEFNAANFPGIQITKNSLITILICTGLSVFFLKTGFLSFFYLVPIGYAVIVTGSVWIPFLSVSGVYIILDFLLHIHTQGSDNMAMEILYFTSSILLFVWIIGGKKPRTLYRLLSGSAAGAVVFLLLVYKTDFFSFLESFIEEINAQIASAGGFAESSDDELLNQNERFIELFNMLLLRGAAFFSILFTFYINRCLAYSIVRLIKKRREDKPLTEFFAPQNAIWVLAGALASVVITNQFKIQLLEILSWNVFVIYAVIFLAQGTGIAIHLLSRRSSGFRIAAMVFFIIVILSPLSLAAIIMLVILGIIENWIPIRLKNRNQSSLIA